MDSIKLKANAKLNLFLDITGKRDDGYHELESVMISVGVFDTLTFEKTSGSGFTIVCNKPGFPLDESNIIHKAAGALLKKHGLEGSAGLKVTVEKNIPSQAGMGGGSADGAAALIAVNRLFELGLDDDELISTGALIGADVPFCIKGGCLECRGIGEKLENTGLEKVLHFAVIKPAAAISTPRAYKDYDTLKAPVHKSIADMADALGRNDEMLIAKRLFNAFEQTIRVKEIDEAREMLLSAGAHGAMMTGSGSAVFGLFESEKAAQAAYEKAKEKGFEVFICDSTDAGTELI